MLSTLALFLVPSVAVHAAPEEETPRLEELARIPLLQLEGTERRLGHLVAEGPLVLTYTGVGCPISAKYAPRLERLSATYGARGVTFLGVNANPQDARDEIATECRELGLSFPVLKDVRQELTRALGAGTTTEVFLFDAAGTLRYRGAVDDQYDLGTAKPAPTEDWLVQALEAVLAGEAPAEPTTAAPGCRLTLLPEEELPEAVTWTGDVAPILRRSCESCHRPGQVGPFSLQTYEDAKGWGAMIASVVEERRMPPWNAHERFDGQFANERRLRPAEREKILRWVAEGMPRGLADDELPPAAWPEGWSIGEPDAVFAMADYLRSGRPVAEEGYEVPREGVVDYQYFTVDTDFPEDRWIRALEVRPGTPDVVHHVLVVVADESGSFSERTFLNHLAVAVPGDTPSIYPEGYAKKLPAGARLVFQVHYTPNGKRRFDRSAVGMIFAEEEPVFEVVADAVVERRFRIPAGAEHHQVRASAVLEEDTGLVSLFPHMHTRGKDFQFVAHYPDGTEEELLFSDYDFNWQESYLYPDPKFLPAGTRLECVGHFDNSVGNLNNPDPESEVFWGEQTFEEMFVGYYEYVVPLD